MNAPLPDPATDGIEEGKRLITVGGDTGLSLAERLAERLQKLTWRTPLHGMRLKGRYPLKLIAVPDDPVIGDVRRGQALLAGAVTFRGESHRIDSIDFARRDWGRAFADHVHGFAWLRDLSTVATRAQAAPIAERLTARWLAAYADTIDAQAWRADLWGRRILYWTAHAPLILSSTDLVYRSSVLNALARGARHLDRGADKAPAGAPRIAAWCGVVAAGLLIPGGDPRRGFGEAGLVRALGTGLFDDGGSVSRSPAMLLDSVMLIAMLRETYAARRLALPDAVQAALERMVPALLGVTLGDRALSSWQGGGPATEPQVAAVIAASGVRTRPLRQARDWGYQRLAAGAAVLVVDAAPPPVARLVEGGCASTLAFEFSDGAARLIVNCGGARAATAQLPRSLAAGLRTTAAHSTLTLADSNSTAIHPDGTLGRGVGAVELSRQESDAASRIEATHDGYVRRFGFVHRRQLMLTGDGRELRGEDSLLPEGRKRRVGASHFAVRFHLGAGVQASPTADGMAAILRLPGGALWQFRCRGGMLAIEDSLWIDGDGRPVQTHQLVIGGEAQAGGASVSWGDETRAVSERDDIMTNIPIKRALLSVSDKTGIVDLGTALAAQGVELVSTGGTATALRDAGLVVRDVADLTGFPEMMDGRVKTLHPAVHGGLLAVRDDPSHLAAMRDHAIGAIDLVVVNLYPFEATVAKGADRATIIENIDIGGPSMVRSAAKNHAFVAIVTDPADYPLVAGGSTTLDDRRRLAAKAYAATAAYDSAIASWFAFADQGEMFPERLTIAFRRGQPLRYGENPHQSAALYVPQRAAPGSLAGAEQVQGKALSYNNIADADAALELIAEFRDAPPTVVIVKHANPCGVATAATLLEAYEQALACDSVSAFGGIIAVNRALDGATAAAMTAIFTEVVVAPAADDAAKAVFAAKKNLRLLLIGDLADPARAGMTMKTIHGGALLQSRDAGVLTDAMLTVVTRRAPTTQELADCRFAWTVAKHVKSNAIVYAKDGATAGIGAGQMNRLESARIAAWKAKDAAAKAGWDAPRTIGSAVASDAFFPFADGLLAAVEAGATAVIQPGGSIRDADVIAAADNAGLAMIFTGMRHFRH